MELFATAVKYGKPAEDGTIKSTTDHYLIEAVSHADAEIRITAEMEGLTQGDLEVTKVQKVKFAEIITTDSGPADEYWKVNFNYIVIDEKTGREKRTPAKILIQCTGYHTCFKHFDEVMKSSMVDFEVTAFTKTKYLDVIKND